MNTFPMPLPGFMQNTLLLQETTQYLMNPPNKVIFKNSIDNGLFRLVTNPNYQCRLLRALEWLQSHYPVKSISRRYSTHTMRSIFKNALCADADDEFCDGYIAEEQMQVALLMAGFNVQLKPGRRTFTNISKVGLCMLSMDNFPRHLEKRYGCGQGYVPDWVNRPCA